MTASLYIQVQPANKELPDVTKRGLPQLTSYTSRLILEQGLHHTQSITQKMQPPADRSDHKRQPGMGTYTFGLQPPRRVLNTQTNPTWLTLLHLLATHRSSSMRHEYTTTCLQIGDCQKAQPMHASWELVTVIAIGKHKHGDLWIEGNGPQPCLVERYNDLEDRNLLKIRSLDSHCPFFLSANSIGGIELKSSKCSDRKAKITLRTSKYCNRAEKKKLQVPLSPRKNSLDSLLKEVFKGQVPGSRW